MNKIVKDALILFAITLVAGVQLPYRQMLKITQQMKSQRLLQVSRTVRLSVLL